MLLLMNRKLRRIIRQIIALNASALIVHLENVRGESFGSRRLIIAQAANKRLQMRIHMPLQAPIVHAGPRAIAAAKPFLPLFLPGTFPHVGLEGGLVRFGPRRLIPRDVRTAVRNVQQIIQPYVVIHGFGGFGRRRRIVLLVIRHPRGVLRRVPPYSVQVVRVLAVHPQEVLFDVVGPIELLLANVTLEGFLFSVDVLVPGEEIPAVRGVRAVGAAVAFAARRAVRGFPRHGHVGGHGAGDGRGYDARAGLEVVLTVLLVAVF